MNPTVCSHILENGAKLVTVRRPTSLTSVVAIEFTAGSRFEIAEEAGLSHFLEHMVFQGCASYPTPADVSEAAERMGSTLDACTSRDTTRFDQRVTPEAIQHSAKLISEMLTRPAFAAIETERAIILEEALDEFTEDGRRVDPDTRTRLAQWPGDPIGRPIIGELELIKGYRQEDLQSFLDQCYVGHKAVISILGPQEHDILRAAGEVFEALPTGHPAELVIPQNADIPIQVEVEHDHRSQCDCRLTFSTPGRDSELAPAFAMIRAALDDGFASRMHRRMGTELGLAYEQWALWESYPDAGLFELGAVVSRAKVKTFYEEAVALLRGLVTNPPSGKEIERIRFRARFSLETIGETTEGLIALHSTPTLFNEPVYSLEQRLERLMRVDAETFSRAAEIVLGGRCVAYCVGPIEKGTEQDIRTTLEQHL